MCFLLIADLKGCNLFFDNLRDGDNLGRDEYTVTITSAMVILILTEGGICGNQQYTHKNYGNRRGSHQKGRMGHSFV